MDVANSTPEAALEEIRFAVILNGGVSLAVWMGGAVRELDRLTRGEGGYAYLLDLVRSTARVDVIAGTSAGGINGAALALSQVNRHDRLGRLRDLWVNRGQLSQLLRQPFRGAPCSLLRGDEYFLPQLQDMLQQLVDDYDPRGADERPIDLTITTTLLHGTPVTTVDDLGQTLTQTVREGRFTFVHADPRTAPPAASRGDFTPHRVPGTVRALALAARSTASFPAAFEQSFVPVYGRSAGRGPLDRPDMGRWASWRAGEDGDRDRSRFAVDGGVLVNTPTRAALAAVDRMAAGDPVRRIMMLVFPRAPGAAADPADDPARPPTLAQALRMVGAARGSQSARTHVEEIERHNRAASSRRGSWQDILDALGRDDLPRRLHETAVQLMPHYRSLVRRRQARDIADRTPARPQWPIERVRRPPCTLRGAAWPGGGRPARTRRSGSSRRGRTAGRGASPPPSTSPSTSPRWSRTCCAASLRSQPGRRRPAHRSAGSARGAGRAAGDPGGDRPPGAAGRPPGLAGPPGGADRRRGRGPRRGAVPGDPAACRGAGPDRGAGVIGAGAGRGPPRPARSRTPSRWGGSCCGCRPRPTTRR